MCPFVVVVVLFCVGLFVYLFCFLVFVGSATYRPWPPCAPFPLWMKCFSQLTVGVALLTLLASNCMATQFARLK